MRVLVTGSQGYVGCVLTPALAASGHQVRGLDSDLYRRCDFAGSPPKKLPLIKKDIRDIEIRDLEGVDAIVHLAGLSNDPLGDLDPALTYAINHEAAVRLAEIAKSAGVKRLILTSSCSVYGASGNDWVDEDSALEPVTAYADSKLRMEKDTGELANDAFTVLHLRPGTVYGLSPRIRFDLVLNNLTAWAVSTGEVLLKSDGAAWRPVLHVTELASFIAALLEAPSERVNRRAFNIGRTQHNYRVHELAGFVSRAVPEATLHTVDEAITDARSYRVSCDRLGALVHVVEPVPEPEQMCRRMAEVFRQQGLHREDFEGSHYQRVAHLQMLLEQGKIAADLRPRA